MVTRLDDSPATLTGSSWLFAPAAGFDDGVVGAGEQAVTAIGEVLPPEFGQPQVGVETPRFEALGGQAMLASLEGVCDHLDRDGRCPSRPGQLLMSRVDLRVTGLEVGDTVRLGAPYGDFRIVGSYSSPTEADDFWFSPVRWGSLPPRETFNGPPTPYAPAPLVVDQSVFETLPASAWQIRVNRRLVVPPDLTTDQLDRQLAASAAVDDEPLRLRGGTLVVDTADDLAAVGAEVRAEQQTAGRSIAPAVLSLVLVALALLFRLLAAASELRVPELALASLRGMSSRQLWALGLAEPWALLLLAIPAGVVIGLGLAVALTRQWLTPGLPVAVPMTSVLAGLGVVLAGAGVAVLAVGGVLRVSLAGQLSGVRRPGASRRAVLGVQLLLAAAAVATVAGKFASATPSRPDLTDLVLPVLLAVVAGLAATRLIAAVSRWWTVRRATTRSLAGFVAARALSRRQEGTLVIVPVTAALAVGVFSLGVYDAAATWRGSVAATRAPADVVWSSPLPFRTTFDLTHELDPEGDYLMAAGTVNAVGARLAVLDTPRMARVGTWPDQWTPGRDAADIASAVAPPGTRPVLVGTRIGLTVDQSVETDDDLWVELRIFPNGDTLPSRAYLGPFGPGRSTVTTRVPGCRDGCALEGLSLGGPAGLTATMVGRAVLSDLTANRAPVPGAFRGAGWGLAPERGRSAAGEARTEGDTLVADVDTAGGESLLRLTTGGVPNQRPVVVGLDGRDNLVPGRVGTSIQFTAEEFPVDAVLTSQSVPFLGPEGILVDYTMLTTDRVVYDEMVVPYVLARADTPPEIRQGLADRGFGVLTTRDEQDRLLGQSAYALALRLYLVVAALVAAMALAGLVVSTAVQLPARRRDAAALRVVGVPRRAVVSAVAREFIVVLGAAALAGIAAGTLAQDVVLRTITLGYADTISTPPLVTTVDSSRLAIWVATAAVVLGTIAVVSAGLTVRGARGATLRESAR